MISGGGGPRSDIEITGDPKVPPIGSSFWSGFEAQKFENGKQGQKTGI